MSHGYGWENRSQLLKSLSASLIAGFLYHGMASTPGQISPVLVMYALLVSGIGFAVSAIMGSISFAWAAFSGTFTGVLIAVQWLVLNDTKTGSEMIMGLLRVGLMNIPLLIIAFLAGYAAVTLVENREQLF